VGISGVSRIGSSSSSSSSSGASSREAGSAAAEVTQAIPQSENTPGEASGSGAALHQRDRASAFRLRREIEKKAHSGAQATALQRGIEHDLTLPIEAMPISSRKPPVYPSPRRAQDTLAHWLPINEPATVALQASWNQILATEPQAHHFVTLLKALKRLPSSEQTALIEDGMWPLIEYMAKAPGFRAQALEVCASHQVLVDNGQDSMSASLLTYHELCHACDTHLAAHELYETHRALPKTATEISAERLQDLTQQQDDNFHVLIKLGIVGSRLHRLDQAIHDFCQTENIEDVRTQNAMRWATRMIIDGETQATDGIDLQTGYTTLVDAGVHNEYEDELTDLVYETLKAPHEVLRDHLADSSTLRQFFESCEPELLGAHAADVRKGYNTACALRSQQPDLALPPPPPLRPPHDKEPKVMRHVLDMNAFEMALDHTLARLLSLDPFPENPSEIALQQTCEHVARQRMVHQQLRSSQILKKLDVELQDFLNLEP
jgi:hypothetical protein